MDKEIDAIVVSTPPFLHKSIIKFAIKNNKHIFCEKPFTSSYKEANNICNLIKRKKNFSHMVNYEFDKIDAFDYFKKKILKNIKVNKIYLNWFININKRSRSNWKENHSQGGGIIFNYVCHSLYYLESLFGEIKSVQTNIFSRKGSKMQTVEGLIFFSNNLYVKLNIKVGSLEDKIKPIHQLKILSDNKTYILETNLDSLSDKFKLITFDKNSNKLNKIFFKGAKDKSDFRIKPTIRNSKKFSNWILKRKRQAPNFFDARRIHLIIDKMIISSKRKKKFYI